MRKATKCFGFPQQDEVRPQDTVSVIGGVAGSSKQGRKAAWKFVKDNWEELYNRYQGGFLISRLVKVKIANTCILTNLSQMERDYLNLLTLTLLLLTEATGLVFDILITLISFFQLTVDGFAIDKMAAEVKVRTKQFILDRKYRTQVLSPPGRTSSADHVYPTNISAAQIQTITQMQLSCLCPCRVSSRVTQHRQQSGQCSSAVRTFSSTPPG